jgi:hypothetical protein
LYLGPGQTVRMRILVEDANPFSLKLKRGGSTVTSSTGFIN